MPATEYANNKILDFQINRVGIQFRPIYLGLSTTLIDKYGKGVSEPSGNYARVQLSSTWGVNLPTEGSAFNYGSASFPTSLEGWGTIVEVFLADEEGVGDGNVWYHTKLSPSIPVSAGTKIIINPQTLIISERV